MAVKKGKKTKKAKKQVTKAAKNKKKGTWPEYPGNDHIYKMYRD